MKRHIGVNLDDGAAIDDDVLGEARHAGVVVQGLAAGIPEALAATHELAFGARHGMAFADLRATLEASDTASTAGTELKDDVIAGSNVADPIAHRHDLAGTLVTEHQRKRARTARIDNGQIRVAQARADDLDQNLAFAGRVELDLLEAKRPALGVRPGQAELPQHDGPRLHCRAPLEIIADSRPTLTQKKPPRARRRGIHRDASAGQAFGRRW